MDERSNNPIRRRSEGAELGRRFALRTGDRRRANEQVDHTRRMPYE
jgi:hypothetical protein